MIFTPSSFGGMQKINEVGHSVFNFYGYQYDGVYMSQKEIDADPAHYKTARPGDGRYVDVNKNGVLDAGDRTLIGDPNPKFKKLQIDGVRRKILVMVSITDCL